MGFDAVYFDGYVPDFSADRYIPYQSGKDASSVLLQIIDTYLPIFTASETIKPWY
jgi:hypothetical protein